MLINILHEQFANAIQASFSTLDENSSKKLAEELIQSIDEEIEPAVFAWIKGKEIPNIEIGNYSIRKILAIRNSADYIEAFQLLSEYKENPIAGEKKIWTPKKIRQQRRQ